MQILVLIQVSISKVDFSVNFKILEIQNINNINNCIIFNQFYFLL